MRCDAVDKQKVYAQTYSYNHIYYVIIIIIIIIICIYQFMYV